MREPSDPRIVHGNALIAEAALRLYVSITGPSAPTTPSLALYGVLRAVYGVYGESLPCPPAPPR